MIPLYDYSLNYNLYFSYLGSKIPQDDRNQIHSLNKYLIKTPWCKSKITGHFTDIVKTMELP